MAQCFDTATVACFADVLAATMRQVMAADPAALPLLDRFPSVEVHATTTITSPGVAGRPGGLRRW